jgi:hypothetical protein
MTWLEAPDLLSPVVAQLKPGDAQTLLLRPDGTVWAWGWNSHGQLGTARVGGYASVATRVDLPPISQVAGGAYFSMALSADGRTIYTWGGNTHGELGIGDHSVRQSTTPVAVHLNLPRGVRVVSIAGGLNTAYALLSNGHVVAWGKNSYGQSGKAPGIAGNAIYQPMLIHGLSDITAISAGDRGALALKANGTVWAWGENNYGQLGPSGPTGHRGVKGNPWSDLPVRVSHLPPITMIASGGNDDVAVDASGNVYTWGRNEFGELGKGTIDPNNGRHPAPHMVAGLNNIVSVGGEGPTTLAVDASGNVYAFGDNKFGEVGDGMTANTGTPMLVLTLPTSAGFSGPSVQVAAGHFFSFAFNPVDGEIYAWGKNNSGELGVPADQTPNPTPINITGMLPFHTGPIVDTGGYGLFAANQAVTYWGQPASGIVSVVAGGGNDLISLPVGTQYIVALGNGLDTVNANGSGTVTGGDGGTLFWVGGPNGVNLINSYGSNDTIIAGAGAATVNAYGANPSVLGGAGSLAFIGHTPGNPTVWGGSGTETLFGSAGENITTFGGSEATPGADVLVAGTGNETLNAGAATVAVQLSAGIATVDMIGGSGNDQFFGGSGVATMTGNGGADIFNFVSASEPGAQHGGISIISDFNTADDMFVTIGYGSNAAQNALLAATVVGGSTTAKLADGTTIEFLGITTPGEITFVST